MKDSDKQIIMEAAHIKCGVIVNPRGTHEYVDHDTFRHKWLEFMRRISDPEFWQEHEEARDNVFVDFCLVFLLLQSPNDECERINARMFQQAKESYSHRALKKLNEEFEANIRQQGYEYIGTVGGIRQYKLRETPTPRPVKKRRRKS